ncbi:MAG: adenylate/guanylate cyclase domain-containing protein [Acidimicrobiia bacterium]|nr:adenylate/guanylate cyclase domain-containing protein [Acidimicrobiia bacterium]
MPSPRADLPTGTVTFFFSDVQDSTGLLQRLATGYKDVLERHAEIIRAVLAERGGVEVSTEGDSFFAVFTSTAEAAAAACEIQQHLAETDWPEGGVVAVRIGLHTGTADLGHDNYIGIDVNRAARISSAGHGGQVVVSDAVRALAPAWDFSDLGAHALKGLERAEHLFQLNVPGLPQTFPPLRSQSGRPNNLPALASRLLGREAEKAHLEELVDGHRLVTITGPGGIGKTRLALEVAGDVLSRFDQGAFLVDLAPIDDPELVLPEIASTVGSDRADTAGLAATLQGGARLLLLDNFEQVISAAPQLASVMEGAGPLKLLITSQVPLRVDGEVVFRLDPLAASGDVSPAVELFTARAEQADPAFDGAAHAEDVLALVEALDGVPLAIELAAARVNVLTPAQIRERIGTGVLKTSRSDAPDRHRSLSAAVAWSYQLLTADQQETLGALSVFRGGASLEALESVAGRDPLDDLAELVDRSLVQSEAGTVGKRFDLLAPVQLFVTERGNDDDELRARHAEFFQRVSADAHEPLEGDSRVQWLAILSDDHENLSATLDRLLVNRGIEQGYDMLGSIWRFFHSTGRLNELELWLGRFFGVDESAEPTLSRARALIARAALFYWRSEWQQCVADYHEALTIAEAAEDRLMIAEILAGLAPAQGLAMARGEMVGDPFATMNRAHAMFAELNDPLGLAAVEFGRLMMGALSAPEPAPIEREHLDRIIALYEQAGMLMGVAHTQLQLTESLIAQNEYAEAREVALTALDTAERAGDTFSMTWALRWLAVTTVELGDPVAGALLAGAADAAVKRTGGSFPQPLIPITPPEERANVAIGRQADEAFAEGSQMGFAQAVRLAREAVGR